MLAAGPERLVGERGLVPAEELQAGVAVLAVPA